MSLIFDIQYAVRLLLKKPFFTATTIVIMAVGLGLSAYTYTLLNTLFYKPLDIKGAESLVAITGEFDSDHLSERNVEAYMAKQIRDQSNSFSQIYAYFREGGTALISGKNSDHAAKKLNSSFVEAGVFEIAGIEPIMGRTLRAEDHSQGAEPVIVLSYSVWESFFSKDAEVIDRMIRVDAMPTRIVGVMPKGFAFPLHAEVWQPMNMRNINSSAFERGGQIDMMARLKPGVALEQANAEVDSFVKYFQSKHPDHADHISATVKPYKWSNMQKHMSLLGVMSVVVVLILLLSCINVGNLLLSRVNERIKEVSVRVALGVPRYRLVMQMLWESIIVCVCGGLVALALTGWGLELTNQVLDEASRVEKNKPFWWQLSIDADTALVLTAIVVLTIVLTSVVPVWRVVTGDFNAVLRDGTRGALGKKAVRLSQLLVVSEIFLSFVVLIIAGIVLMLTYRGSSADYGIDISNALTGQIELSEINYLYRGGDETKQREMSGKREQFYQRLKSELEREPNIVSLSSMSAIPGTGGGGHYIGVEGVEYTAAVSHPKVNTESVVVGSLEALGLKLIEGRYFDSRDTVDVDKRIIISQALAKKIHPIESAVGKRNRWFDENTQQYGSWRTVVGVVSDVIYGSAIDRSGMQQTVYMPHTQSGGGGVPLRIKIVVRYLGSESQALQTLKAVLKRIDADVPVYNIRSYQRLLEEPMFLIANLSKLFLFCGLVAIFLAGAGIYAVVSNTVMQRTQEIGVRRAIGATDKKVLNLFLSKSAWQLVSGVGLGVIVTILAVMKISEIWVIQADAYFVAYLVIPVLVSLVVLWAAYVPTKRALRIEPSEAIHYE